MNCIPPPYLKKGDRIGIVAPARKVSHEEIQPAVDTFKSWGLEVVFGKNLFKEHHQFSGDDDERAADLQEMLDDININAIIAARGGYGTMRIIDMLDFSKFKKNPKWIIGYSDVTVLHSHIHNFGIQTLHATMPISFSKDEESVAAMKTLLFGEPLTYSIPHHPLNRKGQVSGTLVGGNLSLLYALGGSDSDIDTAGKILFLEDVDEYLYHIDRMMVKLKRSGKLTKIAGLIVGGMTEMKDNTIPFGKTAVEIIHSHLGAQVCPVMFGFPAGHTNKNLPLPFGKKITLTVLSDKGSVEI
jgi:muramoyltetrapeptide carboxypeptidase